MKERIVGFMLRHQRKLYVFALFVLFGFIGFPFVMKTIDQRKKYNWDMYYAEGDPTSKEPFGAYYVDKYLKETWKHNLHIEPTVAGALKKYSGKRCNYLVFDCDYNLYTDEDSVILYMNSVKKGNRFIFADSEQNVPNNVTGVESTWGKSFFIEDFNSTHLELHKQTIGVPKSSGRGLTDSCSVWNTMLLHRLEYAPDRCDLPYSETPWKYTIPQGVDMENVVDYDGNAFVVTVKIGQGKVMFNGCLALFNNYAMSQPRLWKLNERLMNEMFDKSLPLVVVYKQLFEDSSSESGEDEMFSVLLKHKPTAFALYILLVMLLLWLLVNSRRKRRVEEEIKLEHNSSVSYIEHLTTLYTITSDYKELLVLEQRKLLYRFRKEFRFDIRTTDFDLPSDYAEIVAQSKGYDKSEVKAALLSLEALTGSKDAVGRDSYIACMKMLIEALQSKD